MDINQVLINLLNETDLNKLNDLNSIETCLGKALGVIIKNEVLLKKILKIPTYIMFRIFEKRPPNDDDDFNEELFFSVIIEGLKSNKEFNLLINIIDHTRLGIESLRRLKEMTEKAKTFKFSNKFQKFSLLKEQIFSLDLKMKEIEIEKKLIIEETLHKIFPIHSIYTSFINENPSITLGFGIWEPKRGSYVRCSDDYESREYKTEEGGENQIIIQKNNLPNTKLCLTNSKTSMNGKHRHIGQTTQASPHSHNVNFGGTEFCMKSTIVNVTNDGSYDPRICPVPSMINQAEGVASFEEKHFHIFCTNDQNNHDHLVEGETEIMGNNDPIIIEPKFIKVFMWDRIT